MELLEGDAGPEVFFGSQTAWWLVVMEFEGHEMLDVLVAVLLGAHEPKRRPMSAVEEVPFERQREEHTRGQHVLATEHRLVAIGADGDDERCVGSIAEAGLDKRAPHVE